MTPEAQLKTEIRRYLESIGAFWSNVQGGPGSKPGDPDMIVCFKGRYVALEAKSPTGLLSPIQKARRNEIRDAGGIYEVVRTIDDVKKIMEAIS